MDITPQELRGSEIKESWRGFDRDQVDDLLERAAATIENLTRQVHELDSRPPADADALPSNRDEAEMLQRTLLLAQRAADDAVNEAQAHARQLVDEAETRAQALVSDAESTARRIADGERRRLEDELEDLAARRDRLVVDADALEEYVSGYRDRVRSAIEADLERLGGRAIEAPSPRPELHDVEVPTASSERVGTPDREPAARERAHTTPEPTPEPRVARLPASDPSPPETEWPPPADAPVAGSVVAPALEDPAPPLQERPVEPAGEQPDAARDPGLDQEVSIAELPADMPAPWDRASAQHQPAFSADTAIEAQAVDLDDDLDDDAFFASLREAVRDEAPLGPVEERNTFFDDEPVDKRRGHFRRRR